MTYNQALKYIYSSIPMFHNVGKSAYKEGLGNILKLDAHFSHPHKAYKTIHIGGTNGKGSTSHMLSSILISSGYKVGLFTSPHIKDFRERIRVNSQTISKKFVKDFIEKEQSFLESIKPSFFELTTIMALKYFEEKKVDIAIIEVGLGGRLDSTNIITPILSLITNISFDHTEFLGDTLEKIAFEKAGIIKPKVPIIIGESLPQTQDVFLLKAKESLSPIFFADKDDEIKSFKILSYGGIKITTKNFGKLFTDLNGAYQRKNINTVVCSVKHLRLQGLNISNENVKKGLSMVYTTGLMGRWQKIRSYPNIVVDTGHNLSGWEYIVKQLELQKAKSLRIIFGMLSDKDYEAIMNLLPKNAIYYITKASSKRAITEDVLLKKALSLGLKAKSFANVRAAYKEALKDASKNDFIFIGGSTYIVADFMKDNV